MRHRIVPDFMYNGICSMPKHMLYGCNGPVFTIDHSTNASISLPDGIDWKPVGRAIKRKDGYVDMTIY